MMVVKDTNIRGMVAAAEEEEEEEAVVEGTMMEGRDGTA